jgi:hypothetical protein
MRIAEIFNDFIVKYAKPAVRKGGFSRMTGHAYILSRPIRRSYCH